MLQTSKKKVRVKHIICRFQKKNNVLTTCIPNFKSQSFKNKTDIRQRSLDFSLNFHSDVYWSRWLVGFLPLAATKFRLVWKISDVSIKTSHLLSHTLIKLSVLLGVWIGYKPLTLHAIIAVAPKNQNASK